MPDMEHCGNKACSRALVVTKHSISYDGYYFCSIGCRNFYAEHDGDAAELEQGVFLFNLEKARRNGAVGGGNR